MLLARKHGLSRDPVRYLGRHWWQTDRRRRSTSIPVTLWVDAIHPSLTLSFIDNQPPFRQVLRIVGGVVVFVPIIVIDGIASVDRTLINMTLPVGLLSYWMFCGLLHGLNRQMPHAGSDRITLRLLVFYIL